MSYEDIIGHPATIFSKSYEELKAERDRYVDHIKSLVDERNRAFNREDDLKVLLREIDDGIDSVLSSPGPVDPIDMNTLSRLQDKIDIALGSEWKRKKPSPVPVIGHVDVIGTYDCSDD